MGVMGEVLSKGKIPGSAIPQIREVVTPIASAFGISDIVTQNIARGATVAGSEEQRRSIGSSPDASGESKKKNFLQRMWGWVTGQGGSGGTGIRFYNATEMGSNASVTIGSGGSAPSWANNGNAGGATSFNNSKPSMTY